MLGLQYLSFLKIINMDKHSTQASVVEPQQALPGAS